MSCAACSARVEKAVSEVEGVNSCSVSLLTNSMGVEGTAKTEEIISAVEKQVTVLRLKPKIRRTGNKTMRIHLKIKKRLSLKNAFGLL